MKKIRIKICGVTRRQDLDLLSEFGVDAVGLNFYPKSPRSITVHQAMTLLEGAEPFSATVGVFVHESVATIHAVQQQCGLRGVQTYSDIPLTFSEVGFSHIPAYRIQVAEQLPKIDADLQLLTAGAVLVDGYHPQEMGGSGAVAPWAVLQHWRPTVPVILAGGLTPDNVHEAIRQVQPWGVDVASGVESAPGIKDRGKVRAFVQAVREIEAQR